MTPVRASRRLGLLLVALAVLGAPAEHLLGHGPARSGVDAPFDGSVQLHDSGCDHGAPADGRHAECVACHSAARVAHAAVPSSSNGAPALDARPASPWTAPTLVPEPLVDRHLARGPPAVA